jgi:hypothetical protein
VSISTWLGLQRSCRPRSWLNPEEDCSPAACREILDEIIDHPDEPRIESLNAAEVLRKLRSPDV